MVVMKKSSNILIPKGKREIHILLQISLVVLYSMKYSWEWERGNGQF